MERARVHFSMRIAKNLERMRVRRFFSSVPKNKKRLGYRNNRLGRRARLLAYSTPQVNTQYLDTAHDNLHNFHFVLWSSWYYKPSPSFSVPVSRANRYM